MFSLKRILARKEESKRPKERPAPVMPALVNVSAWATLSELVGVPMSAATLIAYVRALDRDDALFRLARLAAILANSPGSVMGAEARAWTRDLLLQVRESPNAVEAAVTRALDKLPPGRAIAHAHVVYFLQLLFATHASRGGRPVTDAELAFLMLAANDHIPEWAPNEPAPLTNLEAMLGVSFFCTAFNRSDDTMRTLLRIIDIAGHRSERDFPDPKIWEQIQEEAFGTTFEEYVEMFLTPMLLISKSWGAAKPPVMLLDAWKGRNEREARLYEGWFHEASISLENAARVFASRTMTSGLPGLPGEFFRTPFIRQERVLLCVSPWHLRDHAILGTWAKLNAASKKVLGKESNQVFSSAFGYSFEEWCRSIAGEAASSPRFKDTLILPSAPGAEDEIEDVVLREGQYVALFSVKASLVREGCLKTAAHVGDVVTWLQRFFFDDVATARRRGYRGGAALLLDRKVQRLRAGEYEQRGIRRDAVVLPCIVSFDNIGESGILYRWLRESCAARGVLSGTPNVRPVTVLTPEDYEGLFSLVAEGRSICRLLAEKTKGELAEGNLDQFIYERASKDKLMRLTSMKSRFVSLAERSVERMQEALAVSQEQPPASVG
jgi:hypothetical protein